MTIDELLRPILNTKSPLLLADNKQTIKTWDSLAQMNIVASIEDISGEELSTIEVVSLTSVIKVLEVCRAHGVEIVPPAS